MYTSVAMYVSILVYNQYIMYVRGSSLDPPPSVEEIAASAVAVALASSHATHELDASNLAKSVYHVPQVREAMLRSLVPAAGLRVCPPSIPLSPPAVPPPLMRTAMQMRKATQTLTRVTAQRRAATQRIPARQRRAAAQRSAAASWKRSGASWNRV